MAEVQGNLENNGRGLMEEANAGSYAAQIIRAAAAGQLRENQLVVLFQNADGFEAALDMLTKGDITNEQFVEFVLNNIKAYNERCESAGGVLERKREKRHREQQAWDAVLAGWEAAALKHARWALPAAAGLAALVGVGVATRHHLARWFDNGLMDLIAYSTMANSRADHTPLAGESLEGAVVTFECEAQPDAQGVSRWTPTTPHFTQFTRAQVEARMPGAMGATLTTAPSGEAAYDIPTDAFVSDPNGIVSGLYASGAMSEGDGTLMRYYPLSGEGTLACDGAAAAGSEKTVTARLADQMPTITLEDLVGMELEPDAYWASQFDRYELGGWYKKYFYPSMVTFIDGAIQQASQRGIPREQLMPMAEFLQQRQFETYLQNLLAYLDRNLREQDPTTFEMMLAQMRESAAPFINLSEVAAFESAPEQQIIFTYLKGDNADRTYILVNPRDYNGPAVFSGLVGAIFKSNPTDGLLTPPTVQRTPGDIAVVWGTEQYLAGIATGEFQEGATPVSTSIAGAEVGMVYPLIAQGNLPALAAHMAYRPSLKLTREDQDLLSSLEYTVPGSALTEHLVALWVRSSGVTPTSGDTEKAKLKRLLDAHTQLTALKARDDSENAYAEEIQWQREFGAALKELLGE